MALSTGCLITLDYYKSLAGLLDSDFYRSGLTVYCSAADAVTSTVRVTDTAVVLTITGGTSAATVTLTLADANKDTLSELVTAINAVAGWTCNILGTGSAASGDLLVMPASNALGVANTLTLQYTDNYQTERKIEAASAEIIRLTGRTFKINNFIDRFAANGQQAFLLRELPLVYVKSIHDSLQGAITLTNTATNAVSAQAWVTQARALNLLVVGGASDGLVTIDLTAAANDTLAELVTAVNAAGSGWAATLYTGLTGYEPCEDLIESTSVKIAAAGTTLEMLGPPVDATYQVDFDAGMVHVNLPLTSGICASPYWCWVKYRGGYTTIPEGLQLVTARYALAMQDELDRDASLESERIGDYSYTRGSGGGSAVLLALEGQLQSWKSRRL